MISQQNKVIITIFPFSILVILTFYLFADNSITSSRGFSRSLLNKKLTTSKVIPINKDSYIVGFSGRFIFFGNTTVDSKIIQVDIHSLASNQFPFSFDKRESKGIRIQIDSPFFYIRDGKAGSLYSGIMASGKVSRVLDYNIPFIDAVSISNSSFALRTINFKDENAIIKITSDTPFINTNEDILEKQAEGLFSTAGSLHYSKTLQLLVYLYYYRNEYLLLDTLLGVNAKGRTIDTISRAQVKIIRVTEDQYTVASPPVQVNLSSFVFGSFLLVNSNLLSDFEDETIFAQSSVIDVYNLMERKYLFSFYIPDFAEEKMKSFQISGSILVAMYDHNVLLFSFNLLNAVEVQRNMHRRSTESKNILPAGRIPDSLVEQSGTMNVAGNIH